MENIKRMKKDELIEEIKKKQEEIVALKKAQEDLKRFEAYEKMGDELMAIKQGFINAGFTDAEAFTLMMKCLELSAQMQGNVSVVKRPTRMDEYLASKLF